MSKLIVIDSGNIMHKSIFAYRKNQAVPPVYTYMRMIVGYLKRIGVTLNDTVIIAEDYGSWRKAVDPKYKAQRKGFRESFEDAKWWKDVYTAFNDFTKKMNLVLPWHFVKIYSMEADDLASVAARYLNGYDEKILISSDRDWEMLCEVDKVSIFSPITKKFKIIKNPMKVLLEKIKGDKSDNLLEAPKNEAEFEIRKKIVNLLKLPNHIEQEIKEVILNLSPKNLIIDRVPFNTVRESLRKLYLKEE